MPGQAAQTRRKLPLLVSLTALRRSLVEKQWIADPARLRIEPVRRPGTVSGSDAEMQSRALLAARAAVPRTLDLLVGVDQRATVAVGRALVTECERMGAGRGEHQRRREDKSAGGQELIHVIHPCGL